VLYDADKLEYLSLSRFSTLINAVSEGEITDEKFDHYKNEWRKRIVKVKDSLNFESTRLEFDRRIARIKDVLRKDDNLRNIVSGVI
jgi:hypothetical protein